MAIQLPLVLVTGGNGYIGSHVVNQALQAGYRVRTTVRPGKLDLITQIWPTAVKDGQLTAVEISDLAAGDFTKAFEGVSVLLHVAARTFANEATGAQIIEGALNGTTNVIEYALKAGVKKIIYTSTFVTLFDRDFKAAFGAETITEESWGNRDITKPDQIADNEKTTVVYALAKRLAELKFWELADANPEVDFTAILPTGVFGRLVPNYPFPSDRSGFGLSSHMYSLITGGSGGPNTYPDMIIGHAVHVLDVARAHVLAITAPSLLDGRRKRCIVAAPDRLLWTVAADYLRETRPELKGRLPSAQAVAPPQTSAPLSNKISEEALGMKAEDYIGWKVMLDDVIEMGLRLERNLMVQTS